LRNRRRQQIDLKHGLIAATIARHPRGFVGVVMATAATFAIFVNALFLQHGPHPAPIFATRPFMKQYVAPAMPRPHPVIPAPPPSGEESARSQAQTIMEIQRALAARGFYQGTVDGIWGNNTDAAVREFATAAHKKIEPLPNAALLQTITASHLKATGAGAAHKDPIAALITPSKPPVVPSPVPMSPAKRVLEIQHALADFGYGQIKPTGVVDDDTKAAIEKFERDRRLPVDGKISERFVRELATMTGRSLEQ
jgi:peptidoglycan hydrolase-like protein with peptidoglycan-binding domain